MGAVLLLITLAAAFSALAGSSPRKETRDATKCNQLLDEHTYYSFCFDSTECRKDLRRLNSLCAKTATPSCWEAQIEVARNCLIETRSESMCDKLIENLRDRCED
jgi:hypothetical protein